MTEEVTEVEAGSVPLVPLKHEIYARERALCASPEMAAQRAGYAPRCGKCSQLEKRKDVRARVAWLIRDDENLLREKRRRIEERLNLTAFANIFEFVEIDPVTKRPKPIELVDIAKDERLGQLITEFMYHHKTGEMVGFRFSRGDPLAAIAQLRDMYGFKAPAKAELSGPGGMPFQTITRTIVESPRSSDSGNLPASA